MTPPPRRTSTPLLQVCCDVVLLGTPLAGVALKVMRMFRCVEMEGAYWLAADLRLRCYDGAWVGYALYASIFGVIYVIGFPLGVFVLLFRRRHKLFGAANDPFVATTRAQFGFLYESYGPTAW